MPADARADESMVPVSTTVVHLSPPPTGDRWEVAVTDLVLEAVQAIAEAPRHGRARLLLVFHPGSDQQLRSAAAAALRSLVHASVLEEPGTGVCLVVGDDGHDLQKTIAYLTGPDSTFVVGSAIDLAA